MRNLSLFAVATTVILAGLSYGETPAPSLQWKGFASLREGQVVKGEQETVVKNSDLINPNNVWIQELDVGLGLESKFKGIPATGNIGIEIAVCNDNTAAQEDLGQTRRLNFYPYLSRADLLFNILDGENTKLEIDAGYFPYKYNSSVRNLGEYLFRSGTYPQYLITEIDFPMARLLGLRFGGSLRNVFNFDVLLTTNTEWTAIGDINLSALVSYKPSPLIEIGAGGCWNSMISVNLDKTTPLDSGSQYFALIPGTSDTAIYNYTFAGQKVMGRLTLDLKQLFGGADIFGTEDFKLYSEGAILGVINYPVSRDGNTRYDNILQRIPIMAGFNLPVFKLLDVLSLEVEYFSNPYVNSTNSIRFDNVPVPLSGFKEETQNPKYKNLHDDDLKWSVYAKRTFFGNMFIMGQAASDHIRWYRYNYTNMDGKEALRKLSDWYFTFKFGYSF
jgi:hypothetical protein